MKSKEPKQLLLFPRSLGDGRTEPFITLSELAGCIGVPLFAIRRAAANGEFKVYRVGNGRARVRLTEVIAAIDSAREASK